MRVGNFELSVPEGRESANGQVALAHGQVYQLELRNNGVRRCDAKVEIDGEHMGTFRLDIGRRVKLERGTGEQGRFTFFLAGTSEAAAVGEGSIASEQKGLIQVTFMPERHREPAVVRSRSAGPGGQSAGDRSLPRSKGVLEREEKTSGGVELASRSLGFAGTGVSPGVTGLTGRSSQQFTEVPNLDYAPASEWAVISLRLVHDAALEGPRPKVAAPSGPRANPVPAPVGE